jgi:uncharacterized protein
MVSVNVAQLLLAAPGTVREFAFEEPFPDPANDLHLRGPISGRARLTRTSEGILVHTEHSAPVTLECSRCLEAFDGTVEGALDEEFLPSTDVRTGAPVSVEADEDEPRINEHHEIDLDESLRQDLLTNFPLRPLCEAACPGLCATCGERLEGAHAHPEPSEPATQPAIDPANPFARLAVLLKDQDQER